MPDWKSDADYDFTDKLSPEGWAWEFLRRNPRYRDQYKEVRAVGSEYEQKYGPNKRKWPKEEPAFIFTPPKKPSEAVKRWRTRCALAEGEPPKIVPMERYYAEKWGLRDQMFDPGLGVEQGVRFHPPSDYPRLLRTWDEVELYRDEEVTDDGGVVVRPIDDKALVAFELRLPLKKQVSEARRRLKAWQDELVAHGRVKVEVSRSHEKKWRRYLRALDGEEAGASKTEIALTLGLAQPYQFPDPHPSSKAGETLELAKRLVQGGYQKILFMDR